MKAQPYNPRLKKYLLEVVDNQLRDNDPPISRITLSRLMEAGYTREQTKEKIAAVVIEHIYDMLKEGKPFDGAVYEKDLKALR